VYRLVAARSSRTAAGSSHDQDKAPRGGFIGGADQDRQIAHWPQIGLDRLSLASTAAF